MLQLVNKFLYLSVLIRNFITTPHASGPVNFSITAGVNFFTMKNAQFELSNGICVLARIS